MTREIALHCMKSYSEHHSDLCELCPIYGQTGSDHCFEDALEYVIKDLEQEPRKGHWVAIDEEPHEDYECDNCGYTISTYTANIEPHTEYKYCPNCGAKMVESQESEG